MAKYKVGDKFIMEIKEVDEDLAHPYKIETGDTFNEYELSKLPQVVENINAYYYNKGAEDAWKLVEKIIMYIGGFGFTTEKLTEIFGADFLLRLFQEGTYQEAKAKIYAWEKPKREIKVGDIVCGTRCGSFGIVLKARTASCNVLWSDGSCELLNRFSLDKTGENHADKVADLIGLLK